jgi:hypothetical protein
VQPSFDEPSFWEADDFGQPTFSVRELIDGVNTLLRRSFHEGVWVRGEIEGLQTRNGHVYCSLSERAEDGRATVPVALFANKLALLRPLLDRHRLRLRDGLQVRVHGYLDVYAPTGRLSLVVDGVDPMFTLGRLAADREPGTHDRSQVAGYRGTALADDRPWTIAVGHDGLFKVLLLTLFDLPLERFWSFSTALCGITVVELRAGRPVLVAHNLTEHLAPLREDEARAEAEAADRSRSGAL